MTTRSDGSRDRGDVCETRTRPAGSPGGSRRLARAVRVGVSIEAAVENAVVLEDVAASSYRSIGLAGNIEAIAEPLLAKHFERKHGDGAYYGQPA